MDRLKLNGPIILDKNKTRTFQSADLVLKNNTLQFLNSIIKFNEKSKFQNSDILSLLAQNENINISTGNSYPKSNPTLPIDFNTKTDGAYHFQFK